MMTDPFAAALGISVFAVKLKRYLVSDQREKVFSGIISCNSAHPGAGPT